MCVMMMIMVVVMDDRLKRKRHPVVPHIFLVGQALQHGECEGPSPEK